MNDRKFKSFIQTNMFVQTYQRQVILEDGNSEKFLKELNKRYERRGDTIERYRFCYVPKCPFVLYVGRTKLIQRAAFEKYINSALEL